MGRAGFDAASFSGHSFRRGGASFAVQDGVLGELIKVVGDWTSDAYYKYMYFSMISKLHVGLCVRDLIIKEGF